MTERPMEFDSTTHPDEGTIHAWLDDALDAPTAAGIAEHVRACSACAERVAEAHGLIAGASRIVASLDAAPAGTRAGWAQDAPASGAAAAAAPAAATGRGEGSLWRWLHVTPARAAIAATVLVALGITMTRSRSGPDEIGVAARSGALSPPVATRDSASQEQAAAAPTERDPLLDSALRKNIAMAQPPRAMDAVRTPRIPTPEPSAPAIGLAGVDTTASNRVAIARREVQARSEQRADVADKARVRGAASAASARAMASAGVGAGAARDELNATTAYPDAMVTAKSANGVAIQCYLIESTTAGATWGGQAFPLVVSTDSAARAGVSPARVLDAAGRPTSISAQLVRGAGDSLTLRLRRIGYTGTIALGPDVGGRAGVALSDHATAELEAVTVTGVTEQRLPAPSPTTARKAAGAVGGAVGGVAAPAAPAPAPARSAKSAGSRVTMRAVSCPAQ